jgi:uncharacterized lipoprotein NlpE involved in copper resistance
MKMKLALILVALVTLVGCEKSAQTVEKVGEYNVEKLFTHEGCTTYRFYDGRTVYYTNCVNSNTSTQYSESCGKNCTRDVDVSTDYN